MHASWRTLIALLALLAVAAAARELPGSAAADGASAGQTAAVAGERRGRRTLQCAQCPDPGKCWCHLAPEHRHCCQPACKAVAVRHPASLAMARTQRAAAATAACSALDHTRQTAIRNSLIASCSSAVLDSGAGEMLAGFQGCERAGAPGCAGIGLPATAIPPSPSCAAPGTRPLQAPAATCWQGCRPQTGRRHWRACGEPGSSLRVVRCLRVLPGGRLAQTFEPSQRQSSSLPTSASVQCRRCNHAWTERVRGPVPGPWGLRLPRWGLQRRRDERRRQRAAHRPGPARPARHRLPSAEQLCCRSGDQQRAACRCRQQCRGQRQQHRRRHTCQRVAAGPSWTVKKRPLQQWRTRGAVTPPTSSTPFVPLMPCP